MQFVLYTIGYCNAESQMHTAEACGGCEVYMKLMAHARHTNSSCVRIDPITDNKMKSFESFLAIKSDYGALCGAFYQIDRC